MDLNDKIKQILADKNISPSLFADEIGIQRSSMSHILAGRNKPSLDIVQKIVKRYPELGTNWIMDDENVPVTASDTADSPKPVQYPSMRGTKNNPAQSAVPAYAPKLDPMISAPNNNGLPQEQAKRIQKILVFYSDGTFEEFNKNE